MNRSNMPFELWDTTVLQWSFRAEIDGLLEEVMSNPDVMKDTKVGSLRISDRKEQFPKFFDFIDTKLRECAKQYMLETYSYRPQEITWSAWAHLCLHGTGLEPHYHMGDEQLTSIIYLTDSKASLVLRDPRANMMRNWPQEILKTTCTDFKYNPRVGDFIMFPTFVDHYVMAAEPDFRIAVAIDWCFP